MIDIDKIIQYEEGDMGQDEVINLFQELVNSGEAWSLQGSYGRTAMALLKAGYITPVAKSPVSKVNLEVSSKKG